MTNAQIFKAAHELAKTYTGNYRACFVLALKNVRMTNSITFTTTRGRELTATRVTGSPRISILGSEFYMADGRLKSCDMPTEFCAAFGFPAQRIEMELSATEAQKVRAFIVPQRVKLISTSTNVDVHEAGESIVTTEVWTMTDGTTKTITKTRNF